MKIPAKVPAKSGKKPAASTEPHGRKLSLGGEECATCRWRCAPNESIGNPSGLGCDLARGVLFTTKACDQYAAARVLSTKQEADILKKTGGKARGGISTNAACCITSGTLYTDLTIGGGIGPGRVHTKAGTPHAGKTTEFFESVGHATSMGIVSYIFDAEGAIDWEYAQNILAKWGVVMDWNPSAQAWEHPLIRMVDFPSGDQWFEFMAWTLKELDDYVAGPPSVFFFCDSAANLTPKALADDPSSNGMAAPARMFAEGFMVMRSLLKIKGGALGFTNHIKEKPGVTFGSPEYMNGGKALHHHSDVVEWQHPRSGDMPEPAAKKAGRRSERSWLEDGARDRFTYTAHIFKKNRRRGSADDKTWSRICFKEAGGGGTGVDRAYDIFLFLCMTGQAQWMGKERIELNIHKPVLKDAKTGEMEYPELEGYYGVQMPWVNFRKLVYQELHNPGTTSVDLYALCRQQMTTNFAFERHREMTKDIE